MPKKRINEMIQLAYFRWVLTVRSGVWYADGRSNSPNPGRHSLGTRDRQEALRKMAELDRRKAEALGLAPRTKQSTETPNFLPLDEGRDLYLEHTRRPTLAGGVRASSYALYVSNLKGAVEFLKNSGVKYWNQIEAPSLLGYVKQLEEKGLAPKTITEKVKLVKQAKKWLIEEKHLTGCEPVKLPLIRFESQRHYCWRPEEVEAMLPVCKADPDLHLLHDVLVCLACTGFRIGELASLRWSDIDLQQGVIKLTDESGHSRKARRQLKSGRSRSVPINPDLRTILEQRPRSSEYVFPGARGGPLDELRLRQKFVSEVINKLAGRFPTPDGEQGFKHGRFHSFRHYFVSQCANQGKPERMVMEWVGHADSEMVRHYYHLHDRESHEQMNQLNLLGRSAGTSGSAREEVPCEGDASVAT